MNPKGYNISPHAHYGNHQFPEFKAKPRVIFHYHQPKMNLDPTLSLLNPKNQPQIPTQILQSQKLPQTTQPTQQQKTGQQEINQAQDEQVQYSTIIHSIPHSKSTQNLLAPIAPAVNQLRILPESRNRFPTTASTMFQNEQQNNVQQSKIYQRDPKIQINQINMNELPILQSVFRSQYENNNTQSQNKFDIQKSNSPILNTLINQINGNWGRKIQQDYATSDRQSMLHSSVVSKKAVGERLNIQDIKIRKLQLRVQQLQNRQGLMGEKPNKMETLQKMISQYERLLAIIDKDNENREINHEQESIRQRIKQLHSLLGVS